MNTPLRMLVVLIAFCTPVPFVHGATKTITVAHWGHEKILIYAPLYIAIDGGFFERRGMDVKLVYSGNDDQVFATVLSGAAQFGVGDPVFTAISREKGGEGKVVAALVGKVANWAVAKDEKIRPFDDPKSLNGYRISSFPSPSTTFTILSELKQTLSLKDMQIKEMAFGTEEAALERGEIDLAIMLEPQASLAESKGYHVVWSLAEYYGGFALTGVTTTDSYIASNPETVQAFLSSLQDALTFCSKNPDAAGVVLAKSFPSLDVKIVQAAMRRMVTDQTIPRTVVINKEAWLRTLTIRERVGDVKSLAIADACLDSRFAKAAIDGSTAILSNSAVNPPQVSETHSAAASVSFCLSTFADILQVVSISLVVGVAWVLCSRRRTWSRMSPKDRECGQILADCFPNAFASVKEDTLIERLQDAKLTSSKALEILGRFSRSGILRRQDTANGHVYTPALNLVTNSAVLFDLWKKR